jgi:hypothetical protein
MHRRNSIARREHMIATSFFSNDDGNVSLGVDQKETPALTQGVASSRKVSQRRGGVPS